MTARGAIAVPASAHIVREVVVVAFGMPRSAEGRVAIVTSWVLIAFLQLQSVVSLLTQADPGLSSQRRVVGVLGTIAATALFIVVQIALLRGQIAGVRRWALITLATLSLALIPGANAWTSLGLALAALLLAVPHPVGAMTSLGVWAVGLLLVAVTTDELVLFLGLGFATLLTAILLAALSRLAIVLDNLIATREHLTRLSIDTERERISRDLHDIIGRTLVAAGLRGEAALALIEQDPALARLQLLEAQWAIRDGQSRLRELTSGPIIVSLEDEISTAKGLFARLGVTAEFTTAVIEAQSVDRLFAAILRESVTNMLKHSSPRSAYVTIWVDDQASRIRVVNDGVRATAVTEGGGTGLSTMVKRVSALGGALDAGPTDGAIFELAASVPHQIEAA
ncbi:MAG TPA: histidine kinase [Dermatophilaceae bacterium]|jgi:two-component system sensor histidine kinase DesK|nr:histidine kinase [Dermatophilaceae bacterium]HPZ68735.1 histidine kinase [Dermatophilaceae bacterium]HQD00758.1 histidine kinase [Dermatophilaceae bacterium]